MFMRSMSRFRIEVQSPFSNIKVRDSPDGIFDSWARWTRGRARWPEFSGNRRRRRRRRPASVAALPLPCRRHPALHRRRLAPLQLPARNSYSSIWTLRSNNMRWDRKIWTLRSNNRLWDSNSRTLRSKTCTENIDFEIKKTI